LADVVSVKNGATSVALLLSLRPSTRRRLKRGVFRSIVDLQAAINRFLRETNDKPKPFTWTADPDNIIAAVRRGHHVLDSIHQAFGSS
jgi:hypothetical protein